MAFRSAGIGTAEPRTEPVRVTHSLSTTLQALPSNTHHHNPTHIHGRRAQERSRCAQLTEKPPAAQGASCVLGGSDSQCEVFTLRVGRHRSSCECAWFVLVVARVHHRFYWNVAARPDDCWLGRCLLHRLGGYDRVAPSERHDCPRRHCRAGGAAGPYTP